VCDHHRISFVGIFQIGIDVIGNEAGEADRQGEENSQENAEKDAGACMPFIFCAKDSLVDILIGGVVPDVSD